MEEVHQTLSDLCEETLKGWDSACVKRAGSAVKAMMVWRRGMWPPVLGL